MNDQVWNIIQQVLQPPSVAELLLLFLVAGLIFGLLERAFPATRRRIIRPGLAVDLFYWLFTPLVTKVITSFVLVLAVCSVFRLLDWPITEESLNGYGPISRQPRWLQLIEILLIGDLIGYWIHRWFHVTWLWRFHAIHHSPRHLDWISAYRMHPINDAVSRTGQTLPLLLIGFSPRLIIEYVPFIIVYVVFLHTNIRWKFGPLKYIFASPTYHRWHHSSEEQGIDINYATMFPFWDLLFDTFYLPDEQPARYGVKDNSVPETFIGQMVHPFVWKGPEPRPAEEVASALQQTQSEQMS